jgi:hypothetical protein
MLREHTKPATFPYQESDFIEALQCQLRHLDQSGRYNAFDTDELLGLYVRPNDSAQPLALADEPESMAWMLAQGYYSAIAAVLGAETDSEAETVLVEDGDGCRVLIHFGPQVVLDLKVVSLVDFGFASPQELEDAAGESIAAGLKRWFCKSARRSSDLH